MLIVALVLAVIGLAALVTAVVTSNELIAWVCIGASVVGVLLLIIDALRERSRGGAGSEAADAAPDADAEAPGDGADAVEEYPAEPDEADSAEAESAEVEPEPDDADVDESAPDEDASEVESTDVEPTDVEPEEPETDAESDAQPETGAEPETEAGASEQATGEIQSEDVPQQAARGVLGRFGRRR